MPLKRGLERGSCDFCFRRKIKCDRQIRATQGFDTCSQCNVRGGQCRLDDSDDIRIQRRRTAAPRGNNAGIILNGPREVSDQARADHQAQHPGPFTPTSPPVIAVPASYDCAPPLSQGSNDFFLDDCFTLSNDSLFFLDQIFMRETLPTGWNDSATITNHENDTPDSTTNTIESEQVDSTELHGTTVHFLSEKLPQSTCLEGQADADIMTAAMHAYFDFAASYLPILLADAFWADFAAGRCSSSLLYAVACRGIPFTRVENKWDLEQKFGQTFREKFLEARAAVLDDGVVRLDDLEALALMVDFEYDDTGFAPLQANLGRLFLTHESLVLLMLRYQKNEHSTLDTKSVMSLARASERRVLLYWYVYGLDAFHCLDRKQQSPIPDLDAISNESISQHEAKDYFDAILALAIIARKITQIMCNGGAKRKGISPNDVRLMYEQLALWRSHSCPKYLRRSRDSAGNLVTEKSNIAPGREKHLQLRRAVLWALELNCTMQIEACVSDNYLQVDGGLETEQAALQIEFESVRAVTEMKDICNWIRRFEAENNGPTWWHSLVDLAPTALRNICAGLCFWACQRGIDICEHRGGPLATQVYLREGSSKEEQVKLYKETAHLLRDSVATATSHKHTAQVLERLDQQRALLQTLLERSRTDA